GVTRVAFPLTVPPSPRTGRQLAISRDGENLAYAGGAIGTVVVGRLQVRNSREGVIREIEGTDGAATPAFSPDGRWIVFTSGGSGLHKVSIDGGPVLPIAGGNNCRNPAWGEDGYIYFER